MTSTHLRIQIYPRIRLPINLRPQAPLRFRRQLLSQQTQFPRVISMVGLLYNFETALTDSSEHWPIDNHDLNHRICSDLDYPTKALWDETDAGNWLVTTYVSAHPLTLRFS